MPAAASSTRLTPTPAPAVNPVALKLGYAGLAPFLIGALLAMVVREDAHPFVVLGLAAYATAILSFLGGIHWGLAMRATVPDPGRYVWAVVPSLVIDGLTLVVCYLVDRKIYPRHGLAGWLTLRFRLTVVATLACFLGAASA